MAREGLPAVPLAEARAMVGQGARALIERGFRLQWRRPRPGAAGAAVDDFLCHYEERIAQESVLFPGARAALERFFGGPARCSLSAPTSRSRWRGCCSRSSGRPIASRPFAGAAASPCTSLIRACIS